MRWMLHERGPGGSRSSAVHASSASGGNQPVSCQPAAVCGLQHTPAKVLPCLAERAR